MNRTIFGGTILCTLFLILGTYLFPASSLMWLASMSSFDTIVRIAIIVVLLAVLFTTPPRSARLRIVMGATATALVSWGAWLAIDNSIHLLDIVLYIAAGFALGVEAVEFNEEELWARIENMPIVVVGDANEWHVVPVLKSTYTAFVTTTKKFHTLTHSPWLEFMLPA